MLVGSAPAGVNSFILGPYVKIRGGQAVAVRGPVRIFRPGGTTVSARFAETSAGGAGRRVDGPLFGRGPAVAQGAICGAAALLGARC